MLSMKYQPPIDITQVTGNAVEVGRNRALQSKTDLEGYITQASRSLCDISGFTIDELLGQPHNILRHPDMPDTVYHAMWGEIEKGNEFFGVVKNRAKNGDHYWVLTRVAPIERDGERVGYTSARFVPRQDIISDWEALYAEMREAEQSSGYDDDRRFAPALSILTRYVQRSGFDNLTALVLSLRS